jgi:dipeptidyl aminopeptidase/acylaminoacyl peptidase
VGSPRWSPDGKRIAFDSAVTGIFNVYTVNANGGAPILLTDASFFGAIPSWSKDGKWVYFMSTRTGRTEVWKVPSAGGAPIQLTKNGGHTAFEFPELSALFYTKREDDATLFRSALDGSGEQEVLQHVAHRGFTFGKGVIYYLRAEARDWTSLRRYSIATGADAELSRIPGGMYLGLSVTPDEKYAIYTRFERRGNDLMLVDRFR